MNWRFWRKKENGEPEIKNVRAINDIQIQVSKGLHGSRAVTVTGWNEPMTETLFWKIWDGLVKRENE